MRSLGNISLKKKITVLILATSCIVLFLSSSIFVGSQVLTYKRQTVGELSAVAEIIANNVTAAVVFDDPASAEETLSALRARPAIATARIYLDDGTLFAEYRASRFQEEPGDTSEPSLATAAGQPDSTFEPTENYRLEFLKGYVDLHAPIRLDGDLVGTLFLRSDLAEMYDIINAYLVLAAAVILGLIIVAFLLASRLQQIVTQPILNLLGTMQEVSNDKDYSVRAESQGSDELGRLTDGFNEMLEKIQQHDERLQTALQEAQSASRAKSEFLANMSHELRTPLNAIIGFSEIIKSELLGAIGVDRYRFYAQDIFESGHHLLEVINDILDISKVEAGEFELSEDVTDLHDLVDQSIRLVRERAQSATLKLVVETDPELPNLFIDPRLIKQSLINLLSNAIKFTPAPGSVTLRAALDPDGSVSISVADTGIGIAEEDIPNILQPFAQVESAFARSHQGTGLGLPLTKSFIEAHGGSMEVTSKVGEGTTVTLRFPPERAIKAPCAPYSPAAKDSA